jgi:DNA-binding response OmpR family regulator
LSEAILVIEDEAAIRERIVKILTFEGYATLQADNSAVGVGMAQLHRPDLIICDISMPELNGYGAISVLRSHPATEGIPVIFVTAAVERSAQRKGMELGAEDYITKPFTTEELLGAVRSQIAKRAMLERRLAARVG